MGWGVLFIGYFLVFLLGMNSMLAVLLTLPGSLLMLFALKRLTLYCHTLRYALWGSALLGAVSIGGIVQALAGSLPGVDATFAEWLRYAAELSASGWLGWLDFFVVLVFHAALALGIKDIAMRVGVQKNAVRALRNLVFVGLYAVTFVLAGTVPAFTTVMTKVAMLLSLIWPICNCVLLYSCYMRIAPAEETEQPRRPSRFAFVNRLRDAYEAKTQKAIEADRAYHEKHLREQREKQLARMSKKEREKQQIRQTRNKK